MSPTKRPTTEAFREVREERDNMRKRLARMEQAVHNTAGRKQPWAVKQEIEVLKANIAALERRYRFD